MIRIVLAIVAIVIVPIFAYAQTPAEKAVAFCEARYSGDSQTARLQQVLCIQDQNIRIVEARMRNGEQGLSAEVERIRRGLEVAKAQAPASSAPPSTGSGGNVVQPPSTSPPVPPPPFVGSVPYRVVQTPGYFAATTFDVDGPRLWLQSLHRGADKHAWGADTVRIVVKRNGVPIPIGHADGTFETIYADLDRNGKPDRSAYAAVDPFAIESIYISQVGPRDRIEVVYLVPTGKMIEIPGLPPTPLWGDSQRVQLDRVQRLGRWAIHATSGWQL